MGAGAPAARDHAGLPGHSYAPPSVPPQLPHEAAPHLQVAFIAHRDWGSSACATRHHESVEISWNNRRSHSSRLAARLARVLAMARCAGARGCRCEPSGSRALFKTLGLTTLARAPGYACSKLCRQSLATYM